MQVLQEAFPNGSVVVSARSFSKDTTSHGAAGLWKPFKLGARTNYVNLSNLAVKLILQTFPTWYENCFCKPFELGARTDSAKQ